MDIPMPWPDPQSLAEIESLKAQWEQRRDAALAQARYYEELLESAHDFQEHEDLYRELHKGPIHHTDITTTRPRHAAEITAPVSEPDLDPREVLALMAQEPRRLWKAEDVRVALGRQSVKHVRTCLKAMADDGRLEVVRRKARHVLFRIPAQPGSADQ